MKSNYLSDKCDYTLVQKLNRNRDIFSYNNINNQETDYSSYCGTSEKLSTEFYSRNQVMAIDKRLYMPYAERLIYGHDSVRLNNYKTKNPVTIYIDYKVIF